MKSPEFLQLNKDKNVENVAISIVKESFFRIDCLDWCKCLLIYIACSENIDGIMIMIIIDFSLVALAC